MNENSPQVFGSSTEFLLGYQCRRTPVQSLNDSKKRQSEIQRHQLNMKAKDNGYDKISTPKKTTSQTEKQLVSEDITKVLYMPLSSTIVLKRNEEMLCVPLDFKNGLTIDALVDSGAYVSAIAQTELDRIKQQAPANIFNINDPPNFQIQVANGQLEQPILTTTLKFDIGDNTFAEHLVVMKGLIGPIKGLHFMRHNSVVIDTTHGLIKFPLLRMQAKNAASETSAKPQPVLIADNTTVPPMKTKPITAFVDHPWEWHTTGFLTIRGKFKEAASLLISDSISTIPRKKDSSQNHQHNGITIFNQVKHTNC